MHGNQIVRAFRLEIKNLNIGTLLSGGRRTGCQEKYAR
jgi:hypothetical protein